ncbi:MAG TPA: Spo0E family sporulation regulatory protein-aspartic acid phosphatase [Firmicutes bacterium]|nr:Spo0E family sporulation regulatory protein-aspartic acid phosphatase [Bacillota bacterium]
MSDPARSYERRLQSLLVAMDSLRKELHDALDDADGRIQDPKVQKVSERFDALVNEYMRLKGN